MEEKKMGIANAAWNTIKWKFIKKRLGYTDEEMKKAASIHYKDFQAA